MTPDTPFESSSRWSIIPSSTSSSPAEYLDWSIPSLYAPSYSYTSSFDLSYCPCCYPLPLDTLIADSHEQRDAHLWEFAPYRDLRSFARGKNRPRTIRENKRSYCRGYICRMQCQDEKRMRNKRNKKAVFRDAVKDAKEVRSNYTEPGCRYRKHGVEYWDVYHDEEVDLEMRGWYDDVERYTHFGNDAEIFESEEPYVEVGEDFSTWCQRRIEEMRHVKESRLRTGVAVAVKQRVLNSMVYRDRRRQYNVYIGNETTTTLPTNAYDALGHELLRSILIPARWLRKRATMTFAPLFRVPVSYSWFGEYEWEWYRNESGCWEIENIGRSYDVVKQSPRPCDYCDGLDGNMGEWCYCSGKGIMPAPEEMQRCSLVEWVGKKGREKMLDEEDLALRKKVDAMWEDTVEQRGVKIVDKVIEETTEKKRSVEDQVEECDFIGATWEVVSIESSETWSVVNYASEI